MSSRLLAALAAAVVVSLALVGCGSTPKTCGTCGANASCVSEACVCNDGFTGDGTNCAAVQCPPLLFAMGDVTPATAGAVGATATYSCRAGYTLSGAATRTCQANGTWSGTEPTCTGNPCSPDLVAPTNGSVNRTTGANGDEATYACNQGFTLSGDATRTCLADGAWSGTAPTCTAVMTGCTPNPCVHSAACTPVGATGYSCGTCDAGWTGANCDMPITCSGAVAPTNGGVSSDTATFGMAVTYTCNAGYTLNGGATRSCQADGTFAGTPPTCTANPCTPDLAAPTNGQVSRTMGVTGDVATYSCSGGYALSGNATRTCQASGTWSGTAPVCNQVTTGCTPNPCVHSASCTPTGGGGYSCGTCDAGWTGANCDVPVACSGATPPANGTVSSSSATVGNTITYACNAGYMLSGTATRTCQANGTFTGTAPTCAPVDCGTPPTVTNAAAPTVSGGAGGGTSTTFGATAAYTCNSGFGRVGNNPTCGATGMWSMAPTCVAVCGTYTDVVYRVTGTFAISGTFGGIGNQSFTGLTANASTPAFVGAGNSTPFSRPPPSGGTTFTNGFLRLRYTNDANGVPGPGPVRLVEWYFPLEFNQTAGANITVNVDHSVGLLAPGLANCGGGDAACTNHSPTLQRSCAANATGNFTNTAITWSPCLPSPSGTNNWSYVNARAAAGAGCATGYNGWGNVNCTSNCTLVPAAGKGDSFQTWNQQLETVMLSGTDPRTATVTMGAMQIPNGTGQSQTRLSITSSTVLTTQCGSTPGVDLLCNVQ
jgi:CUB/sushi domain-containing protein